jgi:ADP-ribose pyrophosphatase YjhB (NUDIX family)
MRIALYLFLIFTTLSIITNAQSVFIIIHGTWGASSNWYTPGGDFFDALEKSLSTYKAAVVPFSWSGSISHHERVRAAHNLTKLIKTYDTATTRIFLVAHSHGGNVGTLASQILGEDPHNKHTISVLYTLGTPTNTRYSPDMKVIRYLYNLFSFEDLIQPLLGTFWREHPPHERIANMRVFIAGKEPDHSALHHPCIAQWLPFLHNAFMEFLKTVQNSKDMSEPSMIYFDLAAAPYFKIDTQRKELHERDQKLAVLMLNSLRSSMRYKKNNFGDIFPQWQDIPLEQLYERLSTFVNKLKDKVKGTPFIIEVPHEKAASLDAIKKAGFTFYYGNDNKTEWIFKNDSSIPDPYTSQIGAAVIVIKHGDKGDYILVIEEKTRPGLWEIPGGTLNIQESVRTAAARELKEEVGLSINGDDLALLAITDQINTNRFNANNSSYYYIIDHDKVSDELTPNPNEVIRALYAPLENIAHNIPVDGLTASPFIAAIARHLLNKNSQSHHETVLNEQQLSKKVHERNLNDIINIEFVGQ